MNSFSLGAQIGGPDYRQEAQKQEQQLRDAFNRWTGDYSTEVREFAFLLRIDGEIHRYTEMWRIVGAQEAKRKKDWIEVEIGIPKTWWQEAKDDAYKKRLADEVEVGLRSMIELLQRNKRNINAEALLGDWKEIRTAYLSSRS
ncbi:MAG TPA: hypothetical protein VJP02_28200 [Candidatus Sulfotelmatobacter sp.]|nr:hypothetical protein [Candidatus Sulfotelmatobacter sp.]